MTNSRPVRLAVPPVIAANAKSNQYWVFNVRPGITVVMPNC
jgi:hypothetical protein